jgi:hypothetical protein
LLLAPGQSERYHGLAQAHTLLGNVVERGALGNLRLVGMFCVYTSAAWALLSAAMVTARRASLEWRRPVKLLACAALAIAVFVLFSPKQGPRLFYAPAVVLAAAVAIALEAAWPGRRARLVLAGAGTIAIFACASIVIALERDAAADFADRVALLERTHNSSLVAVPPYRHFLPTWWTYGDDFRSAPRRRSVVRTLFGDGDAVLDTRDPIALGAGVTLALDVDVTPPVPDAARVADPDDTGFSDQLFTADGLAAISARFHTATAVLTSVPGHRVSHVALHALGLPLGELGDRPLEVCAWRDGVEHVPIGHRDGELAVAAATWPADARDVFVYNAGRAVPVTTARRGDDLVVTPPDLGAGGYALLACDALACHVVATWHVPS